MIPITYIGPCDRILSINLVLRVGPTLHFIALSDENWGGKDPTLSK